MRMKVAAALADPSLTDGASGLHEGEGPGGAVAVALTSCGEVRFGGVAEGFEVSWVRGVGTATLRSESLGRSVVVGGWRWSIPS